jgi:outer membrane lipoprotein-sorting protein
MRLRISVSIALLACMAHAQTAPTTSPAQAALDKQLEAIDARAGAHRDLLGEFTQEKRSPLLQKPMVTRGVFYARGDVMVWQTRGPEPTRMRVDTATIQIFYPSQKVVEQYPVQGKLAAMAASPLPRLAVLRKQFAIRWDDGPPLSDGGNQFVQFRLDPLDPEVGQYVGKVRVLLDDARGLVRVFEITDPDGEVTKIAFDSLKTDTNFPAAELELNAPPGTKVLRPLEPGAR